MDLKVRWRRWLDDESGITLIEILGAVMILSIISVTLMGYFTAGMDKSADQSRKIIASNLARMKATEIRDELKKPADYDSFVSALGGGVSSFEDGAELPVAFAGKDWLDGTDVNGTEYRYLIKFDKTAAGTRKDKLADIMAVPEDKVDDWLVRMSVTVHWDAPEDSEEPLASKSTTIDSYIVNRGD